MTRRPAAGELATLLALLDEAYDRRAWHGPTLRGALRGVSAAEAARRPGPGRHNVWELAVHCAYWKYAVWRRLTGAARGSFPAGGSNWFPRPAARSLAAWDADRRLLERMHRELRGAIRGLPSRGLHRRAPGLKTTPFDLVAGIAAHDLYHAGQIQLLKRLRR